MEYQVATYAELHIWAHYEWSAWHRSDTTTKTNQAPQAEGTIPNRTLKYGATTKINLSNYFSDADDATLTYTYSISNSGSSASLQLTGSELTINPGSTAGTATIEVTATDTYKASVKQSFTVTVEPYYEPEPVGTIPDDTIKVGGGSFLSDVSLNFTHRDNDTMTYSATLSDSSIGTVSWFGSFLRIKAVAAGSATVTVTATDSRRCHRYADLLANGTAKLGADHGGLYSEPNAVSDWNWDCGQLM